VATTRNKSHFNFRMPRHLIVVCRVSPAENKKATSATLIPMVVGGAIGSAREGCDDDDDDDDARALRR